jgi:isoleucyl-tRNA synthetase
MTEKFEVRDKKSHSSIEAAVISRWKVEKTFQASIDNRPTDKPFVFYDGPPFLTGTPHHGHLLISTVKDVVARYQTMQGNRVERRWGWDCHGLPAEVFVEKTLGIANKKEIGTKISIKDYVDACRSAMVKTGTEWEDTIERVGRWVEFTGAYKTMDKEYMESVWWAFKELYSKGKIYEGEKILVYCTKDETPISKSEVAMENSYKLDTDPSVYVYFKLENSDEYMLAWTTTPWTLPANVALAVNPELDYVLVQFEDKKVYVAKKCVDKVFTNEKHLPLELTVLRDVKGSDLVGRSYHPLFENRGVNAHRVFAADFVSDTDGSGIVHEAPAYGEEDYDLCKQHGIPIVSIVDGSGNYTEGRWSGSNIWDVNKEIAKTLVAEGMALKVEYIKHEYPHCHRCDTKLMYRVHPSWFMDITGQKNEMLVASDKTSWTPSVLKDGRFKNIIESAPDWNLSRDRYWATPIPVWKGLTQDGAELIQVFGSYEEFTQKTGVSLDDYHLPNVMNVEYQENGVTMRHIGKVLDCWFESGSMPFAQFHYPFENKEMFKRSFPADFIVEAIDQTRGWFYSLTAVNVGLFNQSPFKNLICTGFINAADGRKMSKKLKNYTDPLDLMNSVSADAFRFTLLTSPVVQGEDINLADKDVLTLERKLAMMYNVLDFFLMYASVDNWQRNTDSPESDHPLDQWVLSKLQALIDETSSNMNRYDLMRASRPIIDFLDGLSNWYVRRSRKRFWKSENDGGKESAYHTLYYVLSVLCRIIAPFAPFMADDIYEHLGYKESVHLTTFPVMNTKFIQQDLERQMDDVRIYITEGLALRAKASIKVRMPLASVSLPSCPDFLEDIVREELNVKTVKLGSDSVQIDTDITEDLRMEGTAREVIRAVQNARKQAGLNVDDRIILSLLTTDEFLLNAISHNKDVITSETLAIDVVDKKLPYKEESSIDGAGLVVYLQKV